MLRDLALKQNGELAKLTDLPELGEIANHVASRAAFQNYRERRADNTLNRHDSDLRLFGTFLASVGVSAGELSTDPDAWQGVTWGIVAAFQRWMLSEGYAVSTTNVVVSTVKVYARLAFEAGTIDAQQYALIRGIEGYKRQEAERLDQKRDNTRRSTRRGMFTKDGEDWRYTKKAKSVSLTNDQAAALKDQPVNTAIGKRDRLLMCLLLDHGLRVSEVAALQVGDIDLAGGQMRFKRPKTNDEIAHKLTSDTYLAASAYLADRTHQQELFGLSIRGISKRVQFLGKRAGIDGLSPHDCRHYAATKLAKEKSLRELMDIFGWKSTAMAVRYIESAEVSELD